MKSPLLTTIGFLLLLGCNSTSNTNDQNGKVYQSAKDMILRASGSGDAMIKNFMGTVFDIDKPYEGYRYHQAEFTNFNKVDIDAEFHQLCTTLNGIMLEKVCESIQDRNIVVFGYELKSGNWNNIVKVSQTVLLLFESTTPDDKLGIYLSKAKGYQTYAYRIKQEESRIARAKENKLLTEKIKTDQQAAKEIADKEKVLAEKMKQQVIQNQIDRNKIISEKTQGKVISRGALICEVYPIFGETYRKGYTEDFANEKIKVLLISNKSLSLWDTPKNWYSCEY